MRSVFRTAYDGRMTRLLDLVRRHADAHADDAGIALMPIRGLFAVPVTTPWGPSTVALAARAAVSQGAPGRVAPALLK